MTVYTGLSSEYATVTWVVPTVTDSYDPNPMLEQTEGASPGSQFAVTQQDVHTVIYEAQDANGNQAVPCRFEIFVQRKPSVSINCHDSSTENKAFKSMTRL